MIPSLSIIDPTHLATQSQLLSLRSTRKDAPSDGRTNVNKRQLPNPPFKCHENLRPWSAASSFIQRHHQRAQSMLPKLSINSTQLNSICVHLSGKMTKINAN